MVDENLLLILAENDGDIDLRRFICLAHLCNCLRATPAARQPFLECQKGREAFGAAFLRELGKGPGPIAIPELRVLAVPLSVLQPCLGWFAEHPAVGYCHSKDDLSHLKIRSLLTNCIQYITQFCMLASRLRNV